MWLPTKIYERLPQYWLVLGLLFMTSGLYLGFDYELTKYYFGTGVLCCLFSMYVFTARLRNRSSSSAEEREAAAAASGDRGTDQDAHA